MDLWLGICFGFGLVYAIVLAARWAFKIDADERRKRERMKRRERRRDDQAFEDITRDLRKDKP